MGNQAGSGELRRELGLWDVVGFNVAAILGLRWLSTAAASGPSSLTIWALAFLLFFIPQGLTVIELSTRYPVEGGVYRWTQRAFGDFHGFVAGWCYWVSNLVYFPALLIFGAGSAAFAGGSSTAWLGERAWFVGGFAFAGLWAALALNMIGMNVGKWVQNAGALGTWIPGIVLIALGGWVWSQSGMATPIAASDLAPVFSYGTVAFWSTLCFAFAGLELAPLMAGEIRDPARTLTRAIFISGALITFIYALGTVALLVALPPGKVNIISGAVQAIEAVSAQAGLSAITGPMALLVALSAIGGVGAWLAGAARIPFVAGIDRFLPAAMGRVHPRWGTPHVSLLVQGVLASVFLAIGLGGVKMEEAYQTLNTMTLVVYYVPYLYLFAALPILRRREAEITPNRAAEGQAAALAAGSQTGATLIPGGMSVVWIVCGLGLATTLFSIIATLFPPDLVEKRALFLIKTVGGCTAFIGSGALLFLLRRPRG